MTALRQPALQHPAPAPAPSRRYQSTGYRARKLLLGPALKTSQLVHERVSKRVALAVFSSDPISSTAYATEEMLLALLVDYVLTVAVSVSSGVAAMALVWPDQLGPVRVEISVALVALVVWGTCGASARRAGSSPSPPMCTWSASGP